MTSTQAGRLNGELSDRLQRGITEVWAAQQQQLLQQQLVLSAEESSPVKKKQKAKRKVHHLPSQQNDMANTNFDHYAQLHSESPTNELVPYSTSMDAKGIFRSFAQKRLLDELSTADDEPQQQEGQQQQQLSTKRVHSETKGFIEEEEGQVQIVGSGRAETTPLPSTGAGFKKVPNRSMFLSKVAAAADVAAKRTRSRVLPPVKDASVHSPASFMHEITEFIESELSHLERRFPPSESDLERVAPTSLLPSDIALRRAGCAPETQEESKRALRLAVFARGQRLFADAFKSYKLFLDAIADEYTNYVQFLRDDLRLHKEVLAGMRHELVQSQVNADHAVAAMRKERDDALALVEEEHNKNQRARMQQAETAMKEKVQEKDTHKQLLELEYQNATYKEELRHMKLEVKVARRQVAALSLTTFSDALESVNHQLLEWKNQAAAKEDLIHDAHDQVAELTKDLKRVTSHFNGMVDLQHQLKSRDVRLSMLGFRALFPEEAAAQRKKAAKAEEEGNQSEDESLEEDLHTPTEGAPPPAEPETDEAVLAAVAHATGMSPGTLEHTQTLIASIENHHLGNFLLDRQEEETVEAHSNKPAPAQARKTSILQAPAATTSISSNPLQRKESNASSKDTGAGGKRRGSQGSFFSQQSNISSLSRKVSSMKP